MGIQTWQEVLVNAQTAGAALTNSVAETSLLPTQAKYPLPGQFFNAPGKQLYIKASGQISIVNPTPGNLTLSLKLGSVAAASGVFAMNTTVAKTNVVWMAELIATCRAVGGSTSANLMFQWEMRSEAVALSSTAGLVGVVFAPTTSPAVGTGFDSTASQTVDLTGTWSVASASNSITLQQYLLAALN